MPADATEATFTFEEVEDASEIGSDAGVIMVCKAGDDTVLPGRNGFIVVAAIVPPRSNGRTDGPRRATSNGLFRAISTLAFVKKAIDLDDAGVDRRLPCLEFHIGDLGLTAFLSLDRFSSATTTEGFPPRQNQCHDVSY